MEGKSWMNRDTPISINFPPESFRVKSPLWKCGYLLLVLRFSAQKRKSKIFWVRNFGAEGTLASCINTFSPLSVDTSRKCGNGILGKQKEGRQEGSNECEARVKQTSLCLCLSLSLSPSLSPVCLSVCFSLSLSLSLSSLIHS